MESSINHSLKRSNDRKKMNSQLKTLTHANNQNQGQPGFKKQAFSILSLNLLSVFRAEQHFAPLRLPINEVFSTIKHQHG